MTSLKKYRRKVDEHLAERRSAVAVVQEHWSNWTAAEDNIVDAANAQKIIQQVAQSVQQHAHKRISSVVSKCLELVFEEPYTFKIVFEQKRGKTQARLIFEDDGKPLDPMDATGGGVVDVAAFALRLACLVLSQPPVRPFVVLDEPFKFVSEGYRPRVKAMLDHLAEEMGIQFLMVTHIEELRTGTIVEI